MSVAKGATQSQDEVALTQIGWPRAAGPPRISHTAPGIDGFPAEFWGQLKYFIQRSAKFAYEKGIMFCSYQHCLISCIMMYTKRR